MPNMDVGKAHRRVQLRQRLIESLFAHKVVASDVNVAGVNTRCDWYHAAQPLQQFRYLLKRSAERKFRAGSVLDQHGQAAGGEVQSLSAQRDRLRHARQAFFSAASAK